MYVHANLRLLRRCMLYNRHKQIMEKAAVAEAATSLRNDLCTGGWDGECSDEDEVIEIEDCSDCTDANSSNVVADGPTPRRND